MARQYNDAIYKELLSRGFTGQLNDLEYDWLGSLGYTGTHNDRWFKYLRAEGFTGTLSDMRHAWLLSLDTSGRLTAHVNDLWLAFWGGQATRAYSDAYSFAYS